MKIKAGNHTITLTDVAGTDLEPGQYLGVVVRPVQDPRGPGADVQVVDLYRDASGLVVSGEVMDGALTHRVTVVEESAAPGPHGLTSEETGKVLDAIQYTLLQAQVNADMGYVLGPGVEAFERLVKAEALIAGRPLAEVRSTRARALTTDEPRVLRLKARIAELEAALDGGPMVRA